MTQQHHLTDSERDLLQWLGQAEFGQYGECHGAALDRLLVLELAQLHPPGEHQNFIANDWQGNKSIEYQAVSLTETGRALLQRG
jgi:hypothetical protein